MRNALIIAGLVFFAGCGGGGGQNPNTPSQPPFATGTWQGPFATDAGAPVGTLRLVLTQSSTTGTVTGTATLTLPALPLPNGNVTGAVQPGAMPPVDIGLAITVPGTCSATLSAPSRFTSLTTLEGKLAGGNPACDLDVSGTFVLQKQ
jgi:hypothetical protein